MARLGVVPHVVDDPEQCYRFMRSRDTRYDGQFYVGVTSTRIYCRPSCPARMPLFKHCRFFATAAAALNAGFRACKRCRPHVSPGSPDWVARADLVARAMRLIADGVVDRGGVPALADRLGYSTRQLQRALVDEVGAGPLALARAQRAHTARTLIESTTLPMSEIAFAAGFDSIRQFNDTIRQVFALTPTTLRQRARPGATAPTTLQLRLAVRTPFHAEGVFAHLVATAVPGLEEWRDGAYHRTLALAHGPAVVALRPAPDHVAATVRLTDYRDLTAAVARCRWLLDLDADPAAIDAALAGDPLLAAAVAGTPGRRVPRCVDGDELAVRIVLGQQVSTSAARTLTRRLLVAVGAPLPPSPLLASDSTLTHTFPTSAGLAAVDPDTLPMPRRRARTLVSLAGALARSDLDLSAGADRERAIALLQDLPGVGPWTVASIAMRALGDPDAFPAADLGVLEAARRLGLPTGPGLVGHSQRWRPWRSYATQVLWGVLDHPINRLPTVTERAS